MNLLEATARTGAERKADTRAARPRGLRFALAGLAAVLALALAELGLRTFAPVEYLSTGLGEQARLGGLHRPSEIPGLEYELVPSRSAFFQAWNASASINSLGLRGPEIAREKPAGAVRIALVGDSFTFGHGVGDAETLPVHLQECLRAAFPGLGIEVLNCGVSGYSSRDEALWIRHRVLSFDPDLILLSYTLNDPETHPAHPLHRSLHRPELWERFHALRLVAKWDHARRLAQHKTLFHLLHDPEESYWPTVQSAFRDIRESTAQAGVPVLLVLHPLLAGRTLKGYRYADLHAQVAAEARDDGFEVFDLVDPLRLAEVVPGELALPDGHANARGNRLFAEEIAAYLETRYASLFGSD